MVLSTYFITRDSLPVDYFEDVRDELLVHIPSVHPSFHGL